MEDMPTGFKLVINKEKLNDELFKKMSKYYCHMVDWSGVDKLDQPIPAQRRDSYIDWNNSNKIVPIKLPSAGDIFKRRINQIKTLDLKRLELIGFGHNLELWLCEDTVSGEQIVDTYWYSPYN